jgi:hypothetical protein
MAEKSGRNKSTDELTMKIARSRERVGSELRGLHYQLDFPAKLQRSFRERTVSWLAASTAVGTLMVLLLTRKNKIYVDLKSGRQANKKLVETGFALGALKLGATLIRPAIVELVKNRLKGIAGQRRGGEISKTDDKSGCIG